MVKTGTLTVDDLEFHVIWYFDGSNERIDVTLDMDGYSPVNTENCYASYLTGAIPMIYGHRGVIQSLQRIKNEASTLLVAEQKDVSVENGTILFNIVKESPNGDTRFHKVLVNGKVSKEHYATPDGALNITNISNALYNHKDKPVNYSMYQSMQVFRNTGNGHKHSAKNFYSADELLAMYPQVAHVLDNDYVVIESYDEAVKRLKIWETSKEQLKSFDIESTDTDWGPTSQCRITGVFLGFGTSWSTYFPFRQDNFDYNLPIEFLRVIFDTINNQPKYPEVILLSHNVKFELEGFYQEFREIVRYDIDTYLLSVLVNPVIRKNTHTLKALAANVDKKFYLSLTDIFIGKVQFNVLTPDIVKLYGCPDATSPAKIYPYLMSQIPKDEYFVVQLEMKLPVIKMMNEFYGMRLDQYLLDSNLRTVESDVEKLETIFKNMHRTTKNINSADVMRDILYNQLRAPVEVYTDKGLPSTAKMAISSIVRKGAKLKAEMDRRQEEISKLTDSDVTDQKIDRPEIADIVSSDGKTVLVKGADMKNNMYPSLVIYQKLKLLQRDLVSHRRLKSKSVAGFFKFYINQSGAGSNRQTSDAHQFNDKMKECAKADSIHHDLVSCDWKQVELRILAGMAKQEDLIELERNPDVDIHRAIASIIRKKPMYLISEEERKSDKSVNFGVVYMMSEYGLANRDFGPGYTKSQLLEERKKIMDFYNGLPNIKEFVHGNESKIRTQGKIKTLFNYYRYFPEVFDADATEKSLKRIVRQGNNTPVQGTGAQMLKIVECNIWEYIVKRGWHKEKDYDGLMLPMVRMILPIHDEILLSYDKSIPKEEIVKMFKECMELEIDGMPPFFAAPSFADNWDQAHSSRFELDLGLRDQVVAEYLKGNYMLTGHDYLQVLDDYRNGVIKDYMNGLIEKYKTVDEVAKHVTHDNLTHVLIEAEIPDSKERKALTHEERIHESVVRYMNNYVPDSTAIEIEEEPEEKMSIEELTEEVAYQIDAYGDIIETAHEEDEYFAGSPYDFDGEEDCEECRVLYAQKECIVDFTGYGEEEFQKFVSLCKPDGYYNVIVVQNGKMVQTQLYIDWVLDDIEQIFMEGTING